MNQSPSLTPFANLNTKVIFFLGPILFAGHASAAIVQDCPSPAAVYTQTPPPNQLSLSVISANTYKQLAIIEWVTPETYQVHPITHQKQSATEAGAEERCPLNPLSLVQGGDWGWHVLWQSSQGVNYARVDGEAWVSSVPKRLVKQQAFEVSMEVEQHIVTVRWKTNAGDQQGQQVVSTDEGRSWD